MNINKVLESGLVDRYHASPWIPNQSLAEHQWRVTVLLKHFYPEVRKEVIMAALTHDAPELMTGDIPSFTKYENPEIKKILDYIETKIEHEWGIAWGVTDEEYKMIKICDVLEGFLYTWEQVMKGNRFAKGVMNNWRTIFEKLKVQNYTINKWCEERIEELRQW